jgi:hypothetical protein
MSRIGQFSKGVLADFVNNRAVGVGVADRGSGCNTVVICLSNNYLQIFGSQESVAYSTFVLSTGAPTVSRVVAAPLDCSMA